jgi:hypothetical protein
MLNEKLTNASASAEADALTALLDGGFLDIYDGTQPATADTAITTQVLLASLALANPAFQPAVNGVAASNAITPEADAPATGTATWYRFYKADHTTPVQDGSVGTMDANLLLSSVNIQIHAVVSVETFTLTARKQN